MDARPLRPGTMQILRGGSGCQPSHIMTISLVIQYLLTLFLTDRKWEYCDETCMSESLQHLVEV